MRIAITTMLLIWQDQHCKHVYRTSFNLYKPTTNLQRINTRLYWVLARLNKNHRSKLKNRKELLIRAYKQHRLTPLLWWVKSRIEKVNTAMYA